MSNIALIIITAGEAYVKKTENEFKIMEFLAAFVSQESLRSSPKRVAIRLRWQTDGGLERDE